MIQALGAQSLSHRSLYQATKSIQTGEHENPIIKNWHKLEDFVSINPVMGRVFIELVGDGLNNVASLCMGRSPLFVLENTISPLIWAFFGVTFPVFVIQGVLVGKNSAYTKWLKNKFEMSHEKPLETHFSKLDELWLKEGSNHSLLAKELGLKKESEILPAARLIRRGKLLGMTFDMLALSTVSACIFYFRNWFTWLLSGKKEGFSGEFTYASDDYIRKKAEEAKKDQDWRQMLGVLVGFLGTLSAPFLCNFILKNEKNSWFKRFIPAMEYTEGVYMNRWLMVFHVLFNFNFKQIFAFARSSNETFESIVKMVGFDFFFFVGDDLIAGQTAKHFQNKHKTELGDIELTHKGPFGLTLAKTMNQIDKEIEAQKKPELKELASKLSRYNFRAGLLGASTILGVFLSVINALQTKWRIQSERGEKENK